MDWSVQKIIKYSSELFNFDRLYDRVSGDRWRNWADQLREDIPAAFEVSQNGHLPLWVELFEQLPKIQPDQVLLDQPIIKVRNNTPIDRAVSRKIEEILIQLVPWRKGPFRIHEVFVDSEWQSHLKWNRVKDVISPLDNRRILDVGCGNGYYALRMIGDGARFVIGMDPYLRYIVQYKFLSHFMQDASSEIQLAPVGFEQLPRHLEMFDTVFSMGVLYHQRSPFEHLQHLFEATRSEGEVVVESIVVNGDEQTILVPENRYAKMRNVWFIPSARALELWMKKVGFVDVRIEDVSPTTIQEQRSSRWMPFESLADFLNPEDSTKTFEGYPAPLRAVVVAKKP
jgi:tRNA (mo5U34)-methyltransferase